MDRLESILPAVSWLRRYKRRDLFGDLSAGLIVAIMLIPQGMAYALLAGLPPVTGLYASTVPLVVYALFGSSRQLAVGPVAIVSLLTFSGVSLIAKQGTAEYLALAALLALMVGVIQALLGLLRAGFITNFLSHAVVSGFTSAAALIIGLSQLKHLLGVGLHSSHGVFPLLAEALQRLAETNLVTLTIGMGSIIFLLTLKRLAPRFPAPLVVVGLGSLIVYLFRLDQRGVGIVGEVPAGLPSVALPALSLDAVAALLPVALTIAFVSFMESIAVARSIAAKERDKVDANRELIGLGLANVVGSLFRAYPVTGGFSRSAVNYQAGARTPLASIVTALLVVLTLLFFTPLFTYLPKAVLAAIVMVAVFGLIDLKEPRQLFRLKPVDGWTLVITFAATLLVGVEQGILAGVGFSLLVFVWRSAYPHTAELGYLPKEDVFRNVRRYPEAETFAGVLMTRVDASLYFANMAFLERRMADAIADRPELKHIVIDFSAVNDVDAVALETLAERRRELAEQGIDLYLASVKGPVRDLMVKAGWVETWGDTIFHPSIKHALAEVGVELPAKQRISVSFGAAERNP
ncbi:MAG: solute carrier family 26 protein [Trueperaceae bacterium]|nr:MAG: solute carrier family 26 protein [Trueperaceae bacterium]